MKKIIHHVRKQPEHTKRAILHVLTIVFAVILLSLWVYSLGANFSNDDTQVKIKQGFEPFNIIKEGFSSIW